MPGYRDGAIGIHRHHAHHDQHVALPALSVRDFVIILILAGICAGIVALPVLGDKLFNTFTPRAAKATPITFLLGVGALIAGIASGAWILDVTGACLIAGVLLGAIAVHY